MAGLGSSSLIAFPVKLERTSILQKKTDDKGAAQSSGWRDYINQEGHDALQCGDVF